MMKRIIFVISFFLLASCGHSVKVDKDLETIPKEVALEYLRKEGAKYSDGDMCIYTSDELNGIPYSELEYIIGTDGNASIEVFRKGEARQQYFNVDVEIIVCSPVFVHGLGGGLPWDEVQEAMNKTAAALSSLGVHRVN